MAQMIQAMVEEVETELCEMISSDFGTLCI